LIWILASRRDDNLAGAPPEARCEMSSDRTMIPVEEDLESDGEMMSEEEMITETKPIVSPKRKPSGNSPVDIVGFVE
jgi:hypothetical protein